MRIRRKNFLTQQTLTIASVDEGNIDYIVIESTGAASTDVPYAHVVT
ncbi:hypothetical protein [Neobacillus vireti]